MAIYIREDSEQVTNKLVELPQELVNKAKTVYKNVGEQYPKLKGAKRIKKIAISDTDDTYNKKKGEEDIVHDNGKVFVKGSMIKKADHELRHTSNNPNNLTLISNGGFDFKQFYHDALNSLRTAVKQPEIVKQVKPNNVKVTKTTTKEVKPTKINKINVKVSENKKIYINETQLIKLGLMK